MRSPTIAVLMWGRPIRLAKSSLTVWVQLNDRLVPAQDAMVSVFDRGFMYGDGVFETARTYEGKVFRLEEHLDRLLASAAALRIVIPRNTTQIAEDVTRVVARNASGTADMVVRISVSRGRGRRGPSIDGATEPTYVVSADVLPEGLEKRQEDGVRLSVVSTRKVSSDALPASAKHANYLNSILAHTEAVASGADDALLLTSDQMLAECSGANIFLVRKGQVRTPDLDTGILPGIARGLTLELCDANGIACRQARLGVAELDWADEIFTTNSVTEIVPVHAVNGREFSVPGPLTLRLRGLYRQAAILGCTGTE
jgi:branched-chain amino acid aminotransferase